MSKIIKILLIILISCTNVFALNEGTLSPEVKFQTASGNQISINQYKGNIVYLDFWASWCGPCKKSLPWMNELNQKFKDKKFKILAVNLDTHKTDAEKMISDEKLNFEIAFDPEGISPEKFEVATMPSSYLIGPDGRILKIFSGFDEEHKKIIEDKISESLREIK